ncbi:MAG: T9SS type A sorting domain-containing protein, partial [candidate division Zixibacteria bacterium]|nr:T9SS type A sorting domain-containing protein [candidate division Zixibacteria bacterium]
ENPADAYEKTPTAERECCGNSQPGSSPQTEFKFADAQVVEDGSFEAGTPNPFWNEVSSNFGTPLCILSECGTGNGTGPHSGDWWCWLGGSSSGETGSIDQDLIIPLARFAVLKFWLEIPAANTTGFMEVQIDDEAIFRVTEADEETYPVYSEIMLDIAAYADGKVHNLKFFSVTNPSPIGATNFFVDDVSIETSGVPFFSIIGESAGTVSPGQTDAFAVRFFGIQNDTAFTAALLINSNDPLRKSIRLPLALSIADSVVGIGDAETLPKTFAVSPNFPNPFNPVTTISYDIPQASEVTLVVYNILGQKVRTLVNSRKDPGRYSVMWDAANDAGAAVASGIYIYRFQAGDFLQVRKMVLLK